MLATVNIDYSHRILLPIGLCLVLEVGVGGSWCGLRASPALVIAPSSLLLSATRHRTTEVMKMFISCFTVFLKSITFGMILLASDFLKASQILSALYHSLMLVSSLLDLPEQVS